MGAVSLLKRNLIANYLGQGWAALMGLAFVPLYIRFLGIEAYGLIGLFAVLQAWMVLLDLGMSPTLGREMARFTAGGHTAQSVRNMLRSLELVVFGLAALVVLLVWSSSGWLAAHWLNASRLPLETVRSALSIMAFVVGLRFCEGIYRSALIGLEQQVWFNAANALLTTIRSGGAVLILMFVSNTIEAFFAWQGAISALSLLIFALKLHRSLPAAPERARFSADALRPVWGFARGMLGINLLAVLLTQVDKVLLSRLTSLEDFGYYTLAGAVAASLQLLIGPIVQAFYPRLVALHEQGNESEFARLYHLGAQLVTLAVAPVSLLIAAFPHAVLYAWTGDAPLASATAPILVPLTIGTFLNCLVWMPYQAQLAHGWTSLILAANLVAVAIIVPAILWLVPDYGARAAAQIWLVLNVCYVLFVVQLMHRRILRREHGRWFTQDVLLPGGAAVLAVAALGAALGGAIEDSRLSALIALGAMTVALYAAAGAATPLVRSSVRTFVLRLASRAQEADR